MRIKPRRPCLHALYPVLAQELYHVAVCNRYPLPDRGVLIRDGQRALQVVGDRKHIDKESFLCRLRLISSDTMPAFLRTQDGIVIF